MFIHRIAVVGMGVLLPNCGDSCFGGATRVTTRHGGVPIRRLRPGDLVLSFDVARQKLVERPVIRTFRHAARPIGVLAGTSLTQVTDNHPIYDSTSRNFLPAGAVDVAASLLRLGRGDSLFESTSHFEPHSGHEEVFNLQVEGTETYFAEGVLVHNKSPTPPALCLVDDEPTTPVCQDTVLDGDSFRFVLHSAEAACTPDARGQVQELCTHPGAAPESLPRYAVFRMTPAEDENFLPCSEFSFTFDCGDSPAIVEFYADDSESCAIGTNPLLKTTIARGQIVRVPPGARGYTVVVTSESDQPLVCLVETQFPE